MTYLYLLRFSNGGFPAGISAPPVPGFGRVLPVAAPCQPYRQRPLCITHRSVAVATTADSPKAATDAPAERRSSSTHERRHERRLTDSRITRGMTRVLIEADVRESANDAPRLA
jgi:hypothetical protein